jgi:XTP/dITP diphosphohydrolase
VIPLPESKLIFITSNKGKFREVEQALKPRGIRVVQENVPYPEIQADNIEQVVEHALEFLGTTIRGAMILEDSGLFVESLDGFPGVYSAYVFRTLGNPGVIRLMEGVENRKAEFRSCFGYRSGTGEISTVTGLCVGSISTSERGEGGFGFDPIFVPDGETRTFAEMGTEEKNSMSHRGNAMEKLRDILIK